LAIGRPSGIARAITEAAVAEGAEVTVAGRDAAKLRQAYDENENVHAETADITDDATIRSLAERTGTVDHVVTTASARARGLLQDLDREALRLSVRHQGDRSGHAGQALRAADQRGRLDHPVLRGAAGWRRPAFT